MKTILFLWHLRQEIKKTAADFIQFISKPNWRKMPLRVMEFLGFCLVISFAWGMPFWCSVFGVLTVFFAWALEWRRYKYQRQKRLSTFSAQA